MNYQIPENFRTESELRSLRKKRANKCFKEYESEGDDCIASSTIRLHSYCNQCRKLKSKISQLPFKKERSDIILKESQSKELEISKIKIIKKSFRFPINIAEFPLKKGKSLEKTSKYKVEQPGSIYGEYVILSPRQYKPMDLKVFLASLYFTNQYKNRVFENKFIEWIDLLDIIDSGYYRREIIGGLIYLTHSVMFHYHTWNFPAPAEE